MNKDGQLIKRIREGDTLAFRQLVEKYKDVSLSLACSILKVQERAEDVLQESFITVYEKLHTFREDSTFSTWLYRIVVNNSYNSLKKRKDHAQLSEIPKAQLGDSLRSNELKENDQKKFIQLAMDQLRADESLILRLFYLSELKISEIKKITGFKESKIKVDLHRGRNNLREILKKMMGKEINTLL